MTSKRRTKEIRTLCHELGLYDKGIQRYVRKRWYQLSAPERHIIVIGGNDPWYEGVLRDALNQEDRRSKPIQLGLARWGKMWEEWRKTQAKKPKEVPDDNTSTMKEAVKEIHQKIPDPNDAPRVPLVRKIASFFRKGGSRR